MNKFALIIVFALFAMVVCTSCNLDIVRESPYIAGLTKDSYPQVDGSTSTDPLNKIIACKLFDFGYQWVSQSGDINVIEPKVKGYNKLWGKIKSSQTHNSIINVIDKKADITLSARTMSPDEKAYAIDKGISLIETPIALDAFIFIVNPDNQIQSLSINQIQDIYTRTITNWIEVGGFNAEINPYVRNPNSGSQELMELLVMNDLNIVDFPVNDSEVLFSMIGALDKVAHDINSICYTVYYYLENIARSNKETVKTIAVNGISPSMASIINGSYPYVAEVYAVIRSDLDESSMAYKIYEWLQTENGKQVITESGYISN